MSGERVLPGCELLIAFLRDRGNLLINILIVAYSATGQS
jgi:hypothetical protein